MESKSMYFKIGSVPILFVIIVTSILTLGLSYFIFTNFSQNIKISSTAKKSLTPVANKCKYNGWASADQFLDDYKVQPGDTLLQISQNKLGSTARVNELAMLNLTRYPGFYSGTPGVPNLSPFLEIGWVLKIPPKSFPNSSGNLETLNGKILEGLGGYNFGISRTVGEDGRFSYFNMDKDTINKDGVIFKIGDCVTLLRDNVTQKTIKIDLQ